MDSGNKLFNRNAASNYFQRDSVVSYKKTGWNAHHRICTATVKGNKQQKFVKWLEKEKQKSFLQNLLAQDSISTLLPVFSAKGGRKKMLKKCWKTLLTIG